MPMRDGQGRAVLPKSKRRPKPVPAPKPKPAPRPRRDTSSLGSNAAAAHGYTQRGPTRKLRPAKTKTDPTARKTLRQARDEDAQQEYETRMRAKAPAEAARQQTIVRTLRRLNEKQTKGKVTYDQGTGNYVQKRTRRFLPDQEVVVNPKTAKPSTNIKAAKRQSDAKFADTSAGALKILDQTLRPTRALAGATQAAIKGKPQKIPGAVKRGLVENRGPTFGRVLRDAGAPKGVAAVAGFGLDVATDPTTYLTFGRSTAARVAAKKAVKDAAKRAEKVAIKSGMRGPQEEQLTRTVTRAAAKKAAAKAADKGTGISVKFAGREAPGVTTATAAVGRKLKKITPQKTKDAARETVGQVRPQLAPVGVNKAQHQASRAAERRARATRAQGIRTAQARGRAYAKAIKPAERPAVVDAIERGRIGKLPEHLREPAIALRSEMRFASRQRRRAGIGEGVVGKGKAGVRDYFPHARADVIEGTQTKAERGSRTLRPGSSKRREDKRPISAINRDATDMSERFSTNVPLVAANYHMETGSAVAQNQFNRELAATGRAVRPGQKVDLAAGESVYHLQGGKLTKLGDKDYASLTRGNAVKRGGRFVVLPDKLVERGRKISASERTAPGRAFDTVQGKWKRLATATPGFHVRNMAGDMQMAFLAQPGRKLAGNTTQSARALKRLSQREAEQGRSIMRPAKTAKTIKVAGHQTNMDEFLDDAVREGVVRSAQVGRELDEFRFGTGAPEAGAAGKLRKSSSANPVRRNVAGAGRRVNRWFQNREDLMRLATYKHGLDSGLSKSDAADLAMSVHIDYGDVTDFERAVARRAMPFYTFSARALPIHVKALVQTPGKIATIEKARVELANAFGLQPGWESDLPEYKQRAIPFGAKVGSQPTAFDVSLPVSLLNELPTGTDPKAYLSELQQFAGGLLSPGFKIPIETATNRSLFFRNDIEDPQRPLVSAPSWAVKLPEAVQRKLGVVPDYVDPRSGKKVPGWPGMTNYWFSQLPGLATQFRQLTTTGSLRSGRQGFEKPLALVGVKADPILKTTARIADLFEERGKVARQVGILNQRGIKGGKGSENPELRKLSEKLAQIDVEIYRQSVAQGDARPLREGSVPNKKLIRPRSGAKRKAAPKRKAADPFGSSGGLGGGLGGSGGGF